MGALRKEGQWDLVSCLKFGVQLVHIRHKDVVNHMTTRCKWSFLTSHSLPVPVQ